MSLPRCPLFEEPFVFLRHGETEPNRLGLTAGMRDVPLNPTGRKQVRAAAAALAGRGIDAIYSSPLRRAMQSARQVAATLALPIVPVPELAERNWGAQEGRPRQLRTREATPAGGESLEEFTRRTMSGFCRIAGCRLPLIVAHSGTYRVLCAHLNIEADTQVENCRPIWLSPPPTPGTPWRAEPL